MSFAGFSYFILPLCHLSEFPLSPERSHCVSEHVNPHPNHSQYISKCKKILHVQVNNTAIKKHKWYVSFWESCRFGSRVDTLLWHVTVSEYKILSALPYSPVWQHCCYANISRHRTILWCQNAETLMICAVWESGCSICGWDLERFKDE